MKVTLCRGDSRREYDVEYELEWSEDDGRPTALDVFLAAQVDGYPDLAYRYGCHNELCGVCTIEINGKPRLACRTRVKEGDRLAPLSTLPRVRDFVVRRDSVNRQLMGRLREKGQPATDAWPDSRYTSLGRCIECYACLDGCPLHAANSADSASGYRLGNPYALLRIERARINPAATNSDAARARDLARELGIDRCAECMGCKCQVGINLVKEVIEPLLEACGDD